MTARLEDIKWNLKPGGITYLTRGQWNLLLEEAMSTHIKWGKTTCPRCQLGGEVFCNDQYCPAGPNCKIVDPPRDPLLVEREKTHGSFADVADTAQDLKSTIKQRRRLGNGMTEAQFEALDLICTKIARVVCGNALEKDHWNDIAGYAKLGAEACEK